MIGALCIEKLLECSRFECSINGDISASFVRDFLCKHIKSGTVAVLDNASIHAEKAVHIMEQCGAKVIFLPPCRPYLNPIEYVLGIAKSYVKKIKSRTLKKLHDAISESLKYVTTEKISEIYNHCHYRAPLE